MIQESNSVLVSPHSIMNTFTLTPPEGMSKVKGDSWACRAPAPHLLWLYTHEPGSDRLSGSVSQTLCLSLSRSSVSAPRGTRKQTEPPQLSLANTNYIPEELTHSRVRTGSFSASLSVGVSTVQSVKAASDINPSRAVVLLRTRLLWKMLGNSQLNAVAGRVLKK